jgi:hypothetical protein
MELVPTPYASARGPSIPSDHCSLGGPVEEALQQLLIAPLSREMVAERVRERLLQGSGRAGSSASKSGPLASPFSGP